MNQLFDGESPVYVLITEVVYAEVCCVMITTDLFGSETRDGRTISEGRRRDACNSRDIHMYTYIHYVSRNRLNYIAGKRVGDTKILPSAFEC